MRSLLNGKTTNFHPTMMLLYFFPLSLPSTSKLHQSYWAIQGSMSSGCRLSGGELLRSARALTAATSVVLKATQPENIELLQLATTFHSSPMPGAPNLMMAYQLKVSPIYILLLCQASSPLSSFLPPLPLTLLFTTIPLGMWHPSVKTWLSRTRWLWQPNRQHFPCTPS